jgi:hypothetical protein
VNEIQMLKVSGSSSSMEAFKNFAEKYKGPGPMRDYGLVL